MATRTKSKPKLAGEEEPASFISNEYRARLKLDKQRKTASGFPTRSNGDEIAQALTGLDLAGLEKVAKQNGLATRFEEWSARGNTGTVRMALGNVLRAHIRRAPNNGAIVNGKTITSIKEPQK